MTETVNGSSLKIIISRQNILSVKVLDTDWASLWCIGRVYLAELEKIRITTGHTLQFTFLMVPNLAVLNQNLYDKKEYLAWSSTIKQSCLPVWEAAIFTFESRVSVGEFKYLDRTYVQSTWLRVSFTNTLAFLRLSLRLGSPTGIEISGSESSTLGQGLINEKEIQTQVLIVC